MDKVPCIFFLFEKLGCQQGREDKSQFPFHANFKCEGFFCSQQIVFNLLYILFEKTVKYENKKGNCQVRALYQF